MNNYNMDLIRVLADDYYHNRITFAEFKIKRTAILKQIDEEFNGAVFEEEVKQDDKSLMSKALSFLRLDSLKETN